MSLALVEMSVDSAGRHIFRRRPVSLALAGLSVDIAGRPIAAGRHIVAGRHLDGPSR